MAIDERARHELYDRLESSIGEEATATLMGYLPPVGWADVATKADLAALEHKLIGELHRELNAQTKTLIFSLMSAQVAVVGLALALSRLAG